MMYHWSLHKFIGWHFVPSLENWEAILYKNWDILIISFRFSEKNKIFFLFLMIFSPAKELIEIGIRMLRESAIDMCNKLYIIHRIVMKKILEYFCLVYKNFICLQSRKLIYNFFICIVVFSRIKEMRLIF